MTKFTAADVVQNALANKPADLQDSLHNVMLDKIRDHIEAKRVEMANLFYNKEDGENEGPEDEELEDDDSEEFEDEEDLDDEDEELEDDFLEDDSEEEADGEDA